jgi:replicative DNA helicase
MSNMLDIGKHVPPRSVEAEQSVIGALLLDNSSVDKISGLLHPGDFYSGDHRLLYASIFAMLEQGKPVDLLTLTETLESAGKLESAGGLAYIAGIIQNTPSAANILRYAEIVYEKSIERGLLAAANKIIETVADHGTTQGKIERAQAAVMEVGERRKANEAVPINSVLTEVINGIDERFHSDGSISGLASGFNDLDEMTSGFQPGDLIIVAGRPSMGKTSFAMNIAEHVAMKDGKIVAVFSLEMPRAQLVNRLLSCIGKIPFQRIRTGKLINDDWTRLTDTVGKIQSGEKIIIDDTSSIGVMEMRSSLRRIKRQYGLDLIIVDYLQLMNGLGENRTQEISGITRGLKSIAKDFNVPMLALSQLSRDVEKRSDKRPVMSDLRESGSIEQDADTIMFIYREEQYDPDTQDKGIAEVLIRKQRNGPTGEVRLAFLGEYTRFENLSW